MKLPWRVMILAAVALAVFAALVLYLPQLISPELRGVALRKV